MKLTLAPSAPNWWLRLKAFFAAAPARGTRPPVRPQACPKHHRTTAFFELP